MTPTASTKQHLISKNRKVADSSGGAFLIHRFFECLKSFQKSSTSQCAAGK